MQEKTEEQIRTESKIKILESRMIYNKQKIKDLETENDHITQEMIQVVRDSEAYKSIFLKKT